MITVVVGAPNTINVAQEYRCCLFELQNKGVPIVRHRSSMLNAEIQTHNCLILFVAKDRADTIRGLRSDLCFGFSLEEQSIMNWSHQPTNYKGTFLQYVLSAEGIKE